MQNQNATSIIILQGYVMGFWNGQMMLNCPTTGTVYVRWKDRRLPEDVYVGKYITITGRLMLLDLGRSFLVIRAELMRPKFLRDLKKFIDEGMNPGQNT